jgi:CDP-diacylglycerol--glycerol-3-phosphate 3-phosphatidyltransferase
MNFANKISIFRILLIPFFVGPLLYYCPERDFLRFLALGIFTLAVFSDALDGYIARIKKERTKLGTFLDPLADKLLLVSAFISLSVVDNLPSGLKLPLWVPLLVVSRDTIILLGAVIIYIIRGSLEVSPSKLGKLTTFFQMMTIVSLLLQLRYSVFLWYAASFFTVASGIGYIKRGTQILNAST